MPTSETTMDNRVSPKTTVAVVTSPSMPHKDESSNGSHKYLFSANRLAPEIILIILSFLDYNDNPANLASILTLCKSWARLALELIYEQPVLTLKSLPNFVITLGLQDRLPNGQKPFWETNTHLESGRKTLGIEYRSMIKKPCRIMSDAVPSKDHLVDLWELQALLWTVPALSTGPVSMMKESPDAVAASSPCSSLLQSPLSPPSSPSPLVQSSASLPTLAAPTPTTTAITTTATAVPLTPVSSSSSFSPPPPPLRRTSSSSPSPSKAVLQRRKKKTLPPPGPVVIMLESTATFSEIMHDVLREVPGMKLRHLNYRLIPGLPLSGILRNHLLTLRELIISRSPARLDEYMAIARQLSGSTSNNNSNNNSGDDDTIDSSQQQKQQQQQQQQQSQIHTLALDRCQGSGMTVLTELVRACGSHLRTLEYRQHSAVRPRIGGGAGGAGGAGEDLAHFPTDIMNGCNSQAIAQEVFAREMKKSPSLSTCEPGQACRRCELFVDVDHGKASQETCVADDELEATIDGLSIAYTVTIPTANDGTAAPEQQTQPPQQQQEGVGLPPIGIDPETRMDLAMHTVSELCPSLTRLRLQNLTWLSDNALSGFRPPSHHRRYHYHHHHHQEQLQQQKRHRGLREIELLDSYYASQVTIEGLLELCGPDLEILVVDRRSCWRRRTGTRVSSENTAGAPISPSVTASPLAASGLGLERGLCARCVDKERLRRFRDETMSTGDRIISGLLQQQPSKMSTSTNKATQQVAGDDNEEEEEEEEDGGHERGGQVIRRLCTLMLIEHWVSVQVFKEALCRWSRTLAVVSLRLYKCSYQELEDALMPRRKSASPVTVTATETAPETTTASALERLELSLPWIASSETEEQLSGLVDKVFEAHTSLTRVEINKRSWRRKASMITTATTLLSTSA